MALLTKAQENKQQWLHFSDSGLCLFETGRGKDTLPYIDIRATSQCVSPLTQPDLHLDWVRQHAGKTLNILLSNSLYQLLLSDVPDVPEHEIRDAVELKAADLLSYDIDNALLDVILLPSEAYHGRMKMAFIIALQKSPLQQWLIGLIRIGIRVNIIDIEVTQLRNLSVFHQSVSESGILYLTSKHSRLLLNYDSEMVLSRAFEIGLSNLLKETTVQDGDLEITVDQNGQSEIQLETLVLEIRRSFDYYESQLGLGAITDLKLLCDARHEHLAEDLAQRLDVRFSLLRPEDFMHIRLSDTNLDPASFYGLAGTVYRGALA